MEHVTRRSFLKRSGTLGAVISASALVSPQLLEKALAAPPATLRGRPRKTYLALVETLTAGDDANFQPTNAADAIKAFDAWFADQDDDARARIVAILEEVDAGFDGGAFGDAPHNDKAKHMRDWRAPGRNAELPVWNITASEEEQAAAIRKYAPGASGRMKDFDFRTVEAVPLAYDPPQLPEFPEFSRAQIRRAGVMDAAITIAAHGFYPDLASHLVPWV